MDLNYHVVAKGRTYSIKLVKKCFPETTESFGRFLLY